VLPGILKKAFAMSKPVPILEWTSTCLLAGFAVFLPSATASAQSVIGTPTGIGLPSGGGIGGSGMGGGFGGGMAGASFGGGMAGGSFGGAGQLGFSGGTTSGSFAGTGALGFSGTTGGYQGMGRTGGFQGTTTGPQASNPFRATYANPYAQGYAGNTGQAVAFGQPVFGTTGNVSGLTGTAGPMSAAAPGGIVFASSYGVRRAPAYTTTLGFPYRPPAASRLQADLQAVIDRSSALSSVKDNIRVRVAGRVVMLQGTVTSPRERRLAEALVRLEPGVAEVQNQIVVTPSPRR
jgi:hypothetical protein